MATKPFLMGSEVEYSMSDENRGEGPLRSDSQRPHYHQHFLNAIRQLHGWLRDVRTPSGVYLDNGSRYYLDSGHHNELSSPEVPTPRQIAVYDRAGEQILLRAQKLVKKQTGIKVGITKNNINFSLPDRAAWGQHEAFMCWIALELAAARLIPHLVSRLAYAGAACLSAHPDGMGLELSQRARHMTRPTGRETTHDRAIFCMRAWKSSDVSNQGWIRTNLIAKDSQRCSFGMYLSYGVTGLLFMIMNEGHVIGESVQLEDSVAAMRAFSLDPEMKVAVPLANGKHMTATQIQRAYLEEARPHVESGELPEWTVEVFQHWEETLDALDSAPMQLCDRLDPYLKLAIFNRQLERAGISWEQLKLSLQTLQQMYGRVPARMVRDLLASQRSPEETIDFLKEFSAGEELRVAGLENIQFAVRMQALELNYHELGGLFDTLNANGAVRSVVVTPDEVERAMHQPPVGSRAEARSKAIQEMQGKPWVADWQYVLNFRERQWVDLRDPLKTTSEVTPLSEVDSAERSIAELHDIMMRFSESV